MEKIQVILNGEKIQADPDITVLELAQKHNINIPTLCKDKRLEPITSCFVCVVEVKGARSFVPACATTLMPDMEIQTHSDDIIEARKTALELILSNHYGDCYAPCRVNCPAHTDCQAYIALGAQGRLDDAIKVMKERIPFPASLGRVCPAFCEDYCRRQYVESPLAIRQLKRYIADYDLFGGSPYMPPVAPKIGKKVAVIGGGPSGLTAAYYMAQNGIDVEVFEAKPKAGGMIVYGVPSYRLPKDVVEKEIETITGLGIKIHTNKRYGKDFTIEDLRKQGFEATLLSVGAWDTRKMRIPNEDAEGVYDGIKYLEKLNEEGTFDIKGRVAVIGGGNTAFDCARSALRLGADEVVMVYRRTKKEMPANDLEIEEGAEEGIIFKELTIPLSIEKKNGRLDLQLQKMELGEPDDSGRRRPVPVAGSEFNEEFDYVLSAIGQVPDYSCLSTDKEAVLGGDRWIKYNEETGQTNVKDVFISGDFATGAATVVEAIATARVAADAIHRYLNGRDLAPPKEYPSARNDLADPENKFYAKYEKDDRKHPGIMAPEVRSKTFAEFEECYTEADAVAESKRCLECGCMDIYECSLKEYADEYKAEQSAFVGEMNKFEIDNSHDYLYRDPAKCILCGRCVELCDNNVNVGVYGFVGRGFSTTVNPAFNAPVNESDCISCGTCISGCPVGAITPKQPDLKMVPLQGTKVESVCFHCSVGCKNTYEVLSNSIYEIHENDNYLCKKGRFNYPDTLNDKVDMNSFAALKDYEDAVVYPSPSLSAEEYEMLKAASKKMNWKIANYYSQSSLWQAFAKTGTLPKMDFFTKTIKSNSLVICAGDVENTNEVAINRLSFSINDSSAIYHVNKEQTLRLKNLKAVYFNTVADLQKADVANYDEIILLINPVDFDKSYGNDAALNLYNHLAGLGKQFRTTLFSNARNLYSFYDAAESIDVTKGAKEIFIKTVPTKDSKNYLLIDSNNKQTALNIGYSFQAPGTYLNSKNLYYSPAGVLENNAQKLDDVLKDALALSGKIEVKKHTNVEQEGALEAVKAASVSFPEDALTVLVK